MSTQHARVRTASLITEENQKIFADQGWPTLLKQGRQRVEVAGHETFIGMFKATATNRQGMGSVFITVQRAALVPEDREGDSFARSVQLKELEQVPFIFLQEGFLVFPEFKPGTNVLSRAELRALAQERVEAELAALVADLKFTSPSSTRDSEFFVGRVREAAARDDIRITGVVARNIEEGERKHALTFFNPDPDPEAVFAEAWPFVTPGLASVTLQASKDGDLAHQPLARGLIDSANVTELRESRSVEGANKKRKFYTKVYKRQQTDRLEYEAADGADADTTVAAVTDAINSGDFRNTT